MASGVDGPKTVLRAFSAAAHRISVPLATTSILRDEFL
jgi:hypothetical protein